jgi:hypothetical protein
VEASIRVKSRWAMGRVVPRLVLLACLGDVGMRLERVDPWTFRAWEALSAYRSPAAPFEANRRFEKTDSYGDLAALGNMPELRQYRSEVFTTDALGFRNPPGASSRPPAAIVVGDSFVVGSGVSDDETVTSRVGALLGCPVYNAGGIDPDPDRLLALARKLNLDRGLVIHQFAEDFEMPAAPSEARRRYQKALAALGPEVGSLVGRVRGMLTISPLQIASEHALKAWENGRILPNRYVGRVVRGRLASGDSMLFLSYFFGKFHQKREVPTAYWTWLQKELRAGGLELAVVIVPSGYRVYRPFLVEPKPKPGEAVDDYPGRVEDDLRRSGIPALNLTAPLSAAAAKGLQEKQYLYWRDDIHWNVQGTEVAAQAIRDGLRDQLRCR